MLVVGCQGFLLRFSPRFSRVATLFVDVGGHWSLVLDLLHSENHRSHCWRPGSRAGVAWFGLSGRFSGRLRPKGWEKLAARENSLGSRVMVGRTGVFGVMPGAA